MKKFFVVMMCLIMTVCFMPTMAFAVGEHQEDNLAQCANCVASVTSAGSVTKYYDTLKEAFDASNSGDTIVMLKDFENADLSTSVDFTLKNGVTLDGNGHSIRGNASVNMCTEASGVSTIQNVTFQYIHNGSMASQSDCNWYGWTEGKQGTKSAVIAGGLQGTANIINCTFDNADWDAIQITPNKDSTVKITGNTFTHSSTTDYSQLRYIHIQAGNKNTSATICVTDNRFYKTNDPDASAITNVGIWNVKSSGIDSAGNYFEYNPAEKKVDTNSAVDSGLITDSAGGIKKLFPARSNADIDNNDLIPVTYIHGVAYLDRDATPAAYDDNAAYNTLQEAINNSDSYSITLAKDNNEAVIVPKGKSVTLYSKSYKMTGKVTNNGTLYFSSGTSVDGNATIINNGTLKFNCNAATAYSVVNDGLLEITNGKTYDLNKITGTGKFTITGGTFNAKPNDAWVADMYIANDNGNGTFTVAKMKANQAIEAGKIVTNSTRNTNAIYYPSVEAGIADGNTTLYLLADYSDNITIPEGTALTLYTQGKSLTGAVINNGTLTLKGPAQVVNNGTLMIAGSGKYDLDKISNADGAIIAISGGTFNKQPDGKWIAFGYCVNANEIANTYTVEKISMSDEEAKSSGAVARYSSSTYVGREYYKTLQAAVTAYPSLVYLLTDVTENISSNGIIGVYCDDYAFTGAMSSKATIKISTGTAFLNSIECETLNAGDSNYVANITVKDGSATDIIVSKNANLTIEGGTYTGSITMNSGGDGSLTITGGTFSSDVSQYIPKDYVEYAMRNGTYIVKAKDADMPAFTTGNYWSDLVGKVYTEMYSAPYIPPTTPTTPTDNVTNSGSTTTDNASTNADLSNTTSTSNGTTTATVDKTTADKIVDKAVENKSTEVVIDATANTTTAADSTTIAQVTIPTETLGAIAGKTEADVTIKTDVAEVKMDNAAATAVSEQATGETVQIIAEKVAEETDKVEFELKVVCSDGKVISNFNGGNIAVTVALPKAMAEKKVVCVYIDDNGHMSKVEGQKNADGTYTFVTGHFSSYAILAEEEADAAIAAQKEAIKNIEIKLTSKQVKTKVGKKGIKITWTAAAGDKTLDGVEVYRSTERYKGYGTKPFYTSTKGGNEGSYINTKSLKKGTKYYYRVRGYVLVNGEKVYTDYSTKAWRTVK